MRLSVVSFARGARRQLGGVDRVAHALQLRPSCIASWKKSWRYNRLAPIPRGRPTKDSDPITRHEIIDLFQLLGPDVGLPTLRHFFPEAAKAELEDILRRGKALFRRSARSALLNLRWLSPGTVWALDFICAPTPVDTLFPYILNVRDLASGKLLAAMPLPTRDMRHVTDLLSALFKEHGAPLVLKADNEFDAEELHALLDRHRVTQLLSPPYYPEYNGAVEAGNGSLKVRAHHHAARHGHPGQWNCDDVEAARLQANQTSRPWGLHDHTPDSRWAHARDQAPGRLLVSDALRAAFLATLQQTHAEELASLEQTQPLLPGLARDARKLASVRRAAISRALVAHGLLSYRRSRFSPPIQSDFASVIS